MAEVPFSGHVGVITAVAQQAGQRHHVLAQHALIMIIRELLWRNRLWNIRNAITVAVYPSQQHGTGGSTVRRRVIVGERQSGGGQPRNIRRVNLATERRNVGKTQIIGKDQHHIGAFVIL